MFTHLPYHFPVSLQQTALVLNTMLLIVALLVAELVYAEANPRRRKELRYFLPIFVTFIGVLVYAVYLQRKGL